MNSRGRKWAPSRTEALRIVTLVWTVALSAWFAYDYSVNKSQSEAVIALYGVALFLTAIICVPLLIQRYKW